MKKVFSEIRENLKQFIENDEDNYLNSAITINRLYSKLTDFHPVIPDIEYPFEELQFYSNKLQVAVDADVQKYYQLCLQRLAVLENKAEQAGAI